MSEIKNVKIVLRSTPFLGRYSGLCTACRACLVRGGYRLVFSFSVFMCGAAAGKPVMH